ncbi:MAG TPA: universal stress protein [Stellaceae bacterium]|jgi:nucleotide-binding universal stress UspA family protein|nr:universal stress protein [Stellaceae bacterium]
MIRKIFVPLTGGEGDVAALAVAFTTAQQQRAHVDAALLRFDQRYDPPKLDETLPPGLFEEVATLLADHDAAEHEAARRFEAARLAVAAPLAETAPVAPASPASLGLSARWLGLRPAERIVRDGGLADLLVVGPQSPSDNPRPNAVRRAALMTAGRPLLLAPPNPPPRIGGRVAIAWNGSTGGAQAVAAALPFLSVAESVTALTVKTARTRSIEGERLVDYLAWHGIKASADVLDAGSEPVGATLLRHAGEMGTDLLVMGGYVQNRLQEFLLGGVTGYAFAHAELPILVAR